MKIIEILGEPKNTFEYNFSSVEGKEKTSNDNNTYPYKDCTYTSRVKENNVFSKERTYKHLREGCRGILICDGKILLSYESKVDQYLIPGGGIEDGEGLEQCCVRELMEETGVIVKPRTHYLTLEEYYNDYYFKSNYFICDYIGECECALTDEERQKGLVPTWVDFDKALSIFSDYEKYKDTDNMRYGAYYRELIALTELQK